METKKKKNKIVGWILLVILLILILALNYIKFFVNTDNENITETPVENSASEAIQTALAQITDNFNDNEKINEYEENNIKINAITNNNSIFISYETDKVVTYEFNYKNLFLEITIANEEKNIKQFNQVYEILINAAQKRINNEETIDEYIKSYLDGTKEYDGFSREEKSSNITYKMNITKKIGDSVTDDTATNDNSLDNNIDSDEVNTNGENDEEGGEE